MIESLSQPKGLVLHGTHWSELSHSDREEVWRVYRNTQAQRPNRPLARIEVRYVDSSLTGGGFVAVKAE